MTKVVSKTFTQHINVFILNVGRSRMLQRKVFFVGFMLRYPEQVICAKYQVLEHIGRAVRMSVSGYRG